MITINNPKLIVPTIDALAAFFEAGFKFHETMMQQGVKAYRANDGWVDRENHEITFFRNERRDEGYCWSSLDLQPGDLIHIGCASDTHGMFAKVTGVIHRYDLEAKYKYKLMQDETLDSER